MRRLSPYILITVFSLLLTLIWFRHGNIMGAGESGLPFYDLNSQYQLSSYSWGEPGLGNSLGIGVAASPTFWFFTRLLNIGVPAVIIQAAFFAFLFITAGISIYLLTKELFPKLDNRFFILATLFYWFNPLTMVNVWNRFLYNYMVFWALLPLFFYLFYRGLNKLELKHAILTSLATSVFAFTMTSSVFMILLLGTVFYCLLFFTLFNKIPKLFLFKYTILFISSFLFVNFWWITQLFGFLFSSSYSAITTEFFSSSGNLSSLTSISQRLGQLSGIYKFFHISFIADGPNWVRLYNFPVVGIFEYLITIIILWVTLKFKGVKNVLFLGFLFILTIFVMKGNEQPLGEIFEYFFLKFPPLQVFRNPFEKFGFLLPLVSAPLFAYSLSNINYGLHIRVRQRTIWVTALILLLTLWGLPFWSGLIFSYPIYPYDKSSQLVSYEVDAPNYYKEMSKWLEKQGNNFRFVSLPQGAEGITYLWPKQYSGVESSSVLFKTPNISFNTTVPLYFDLVTQLSKYQFDSQILSFFPYISSRFIVWRNDIDFKARRIADPQIILTKLTEWVKMGLITKRFEAGNLIAFEVNNSWYWPKIYSTKNINVSNSKDLAILSGYIKDFPLKKTVFVNERKSDNDLKYTNEIYVPNNSFVQKITTPDPKNFTDEEILGKLFYANHLPGEFIYPFIRFSEKIAEVKEKDDDGRLVYKIGILGKRAVEIYKLKKNGMSKELIDDAHNKYEAELSNISPSILGYNKLDKAVTQVITDSLLYQSVILERSGFASTGITISELLTKWEVKPTYNLPLSKSMYIVNMFKIPGGSYTLNGADNGIVFIDGKELSTGKNVPLNLSDGRHEISVNLEDEEVFKYLIKNTEQVTIDEKNKGHWEFPIADKPRNYQIDFDYRFIAGRAFEIKVLEDLENYTKPSLSSVIEVNPKNYDWQHFNREMTSSLGATNAYLDFNPAKEKFCEKVLLVLTKCDIRDSDLRVEVKNFEIKEVNLPQLTLVIKNDNLSDSSSSLVFEEIDPTKYSVHVNKKDSNPEVMVFSELYNSGWKLASADGKNYPDSSHLLVNDYANGWLITEAGNYDLSINFEPQKSLNLGSKISLYSIIISCILLVFYQLRRKKYEVH